MKYKLLFLVLGVIFLISCMPQVYVNYYPGFHRFPPTDPSSVELLRHEPGRRHIRFAEVSIEQTPDLSPYYVEQRLREKAAAIGAQALVIVVDNALRRGTVMWRDWSPRRVYRERERIIVGVAIRFER